MSRLERNPNDPLSRMQQSQAARARRPASRPKDGIVARSSAEVSLFMRIRVEPSLLPPVAPRVATYRSYFREWPNFPTSSRASRPSPEPAPAPTFSECVIGYRRWLLDPLMQLWPVSVRDHGPWIPGVNESRCFVVCRSCRMGRSYGILSYDDRDGIFGPCTCSQGRHSSPEEGCGCGLYSWRRPKNATSFEDGALGVSGAVAVWGGLQVHRSGFRGSRACVVTLARDPELDPQLAPVLEAVADRYGVELVDHGDLEQAASRYGSPLPDSVGPPQQAWLDWLDITGRLITGRPI